MSKKAESDEEMLDRIKDKIEHPKPSGPWEHDMMRKAVIEAVSNPKYVDDKRLKWVHSMIFGTMIETVEVRQIQQMMISMDNQFKAVKKREEKKDLEYNRRFRVLTYAILAIGGVTTVTGNMGEVGLEIILAILRGIGII